MTGQFNIYAAIAVGLGRKLQPDSEDFKDGITAADSVITDSTERVLLQSQFLAG